MNFWKRVLISIPDQIASTFVILGGLYVVYRGIMALAENPPEFILVCWPLGLGIAFGLLKAFTDHKLDIKPEDD